VRVLVVDDDFTSRNILTAMLHDLGTVEVAVTGTEAMDAIAHSFNSTDPYRLICLDLKLPGRSGQDVLHFIRSAERMRGLQHPVPVFIITGDHSRGSVIGTAKEGSNGYLVKPFDLEHLEHLLQRCGLREISQ